MNLSFQLVCAGCTGFVFEPARAIGLGQRHLHEAGVVYTAFTGFILINVVLLISKAIGDKISYKTTVVFSLNGAILFAIAAILLLIKRVTVMKNSIFHPNMYLVSLMTTSISFAFVNTIIFIVDTFFTFRLKKDL